MFIYTSRFIIGAKFKFLLARLFILLEPANRSNLLSTFKRQDWQTVTEIIEL